MISTAAHGAFHNFSLCRMPFAWLGTIGLVTRVQRCRQGAHVSASRAPPIRPCHSLLSEEFDILT